MSPGWEGLLSAVHGVQKLKLPISQSTLYHMHVQCTFFIVQNMYVQFYFEFYSYSSFGRSSGEYLIRSLHTSEFQPL